MEEKQIQFSCMVFAFFHIVISFISDISFFRPDVPWYMTVYVYIKPLSCCAIIAFWLIWSKKVCLANNRDREAQLFIKHFSFYFVIMLLFLVLVWPGVWRSDETALLTTDLTLKFHGWHHWLTDAFYIFSLCIFAFPTGIIIVQIIIISLIVARVLTNAQIHFGKRALFLYIPLLFPTIIDNNLYPLRASLLTFIELFMISEILFSAFDRKKIKDRTLAFWTVIIAIIAIWRTEGIYYIFLPFVLVLFEGRRVSKLMKTMSMFFIAMLLVVGSNIIQGKMLNSTTYQLSPIITHLQAITQVNCSEDDYEIIYSVFPENLGDDYAAGFVELVGNNVENTNPEFKESVGNLKKLYIRKVFEHPILYLRKCIEIFSNTSLAYYSSTPYPNIMVADSSSAFDEGYEIYYGTLASNFHGNYILHMPLNKNFRKMAIRFLECRAFDNYYTVRAWSLLFYNIIPSIIMLIYVSIASILKKRWLFLVLSLFIIARAAAVFLTAPVSYFMYYMPVFLNGYTMLIFWLLANRKIRGTVQC